MLGLLIPTVSTWFNQGSLASQVNGTSSSNLTGAGAARSSTTPTNGTQLASAFENLISQINSANPAGNTRGVAATANPGLQAVNGLHHRHGGLALSALLQQLDELAAGTTGPSSAASASTAGATAVNTAGTTTSAGAASASNVEATLNQLLQNLKLAASSTNVAALNSATAAHSAQSLAQRLAQQGVQARAGHLLSAVV